MSAVSASSTMIAARSGHHGRPGASFEPLTGEARVRDEGHLVGRRGLHGLDPANRQVAGPLQASIQPVGQLS